MSLMAVMLPVMESINFRDESLFSIEHAIARHGFFISYVLGDDRKIPWAYTIGLTESVDHPEVVVFGLSQSATSVLLHHVYERAAELAPLPIGREADNRDRGLAFRLLRIPRPHILGGPELMLGWFDYYLAVGRDPGLRAVQLVWADRTGRLPWEPDSDPECTQPLLDEQPGPFAGQGRLVWPPEPGW
jgi:hypothetical protein